MTTPTQRLLLWIILVLLTPPLLSQETDAIAGKLFEKARKKSIEQKWDEAIAYLDLLNDSHPGSAYADDALYWLGYCLENQPHRRFDAFNRYAQLISEFPDSPWTDDARVHQLSLAETFVNQGQEQYRRFLRRYLDDDASHIRYEAALSLASIGDSSAVQILDSLKTHPAYRERAKAIIEPAAKKMTDLQNTPAKPGKSIAFLVEKMPEFETTDTKEDQGRNRLFRKSRRYQAYRELLRKTDSWSAQDLEDFALWHIIPPGLYEEYRSLQHPYDRMEWRRKFWKMRDPTPTTEANEQKIEFDRRVDYARSHYYKYWNDKEFDYLSDQYLRHGWYHAPWDARGELYIKYGKPDRREVIEWQTERWTYYRFEAELIVRQYMTDIYHQAISGNTLSSRRGIQDDGIDPAVNRNILKNRTGPGAETSSVDVASRVGNLKLRQRAFSKSIGGIHDKKTIENRMVHTHQFDYHLKRNSKPLSELELAIETNIPSAGTVAIHYEIPMKKLKIKRGNGIPEVRYLRSYVIFDQDWREVTHDARIFTVNSGKPKKETLRETISQDLTRGSYLVVIQIEDQYDKRLGIYKQSFEVR